MKKRMDKHLKRKKYEIAALLSSVIIFLTAGGTYYFRANAKIQAEAAKKTVQQQKSLTAEKTEKANAIMSFAGDCTIGYDNNFGYANTFPAVFKSHNSDYSYFFKNVKDIFSKDDLTAVNLEGTFTSATVKAVKTYNFKSSPDFAKVLTAGGIEAVNISNNHIYDYLNQGFADTKTALSNEKINYFGEGNKYITEIKGIKFGFLGYNAFNGNESFLNTLKADITSLKAQGCIVIINFHFGVEGSYTPNQSQKNIAHFAVDNGADMIIGHHPHVIQGIETYKNKIICYSMGNFCFGGNTNPSDKDTFIIQADFKTENKKLVSYGVRIIPCSLSSVTYTNDYCPTPKTGSSKDSFLSRLSKLSPDAGFNISDQFYYIKQ